jgi:hypothetical protein
MSSTEGFIYEVQNPVDLAMTRADVVMSQAADFDVTRAEKDALVELDEIAAEAGFHETAYVIESSNAFAISVSFDRDEPVSLQHFESGLFFEGRLSCFSIVKIGRLAIGDEELRIRSLCLTFGSVTLLPFFDRIDDTQLLHVPVHAVTHISGQEAA